MAPIAGVNIVQTHMNAAIARAPYKYDRLNRPHTIASAIDGPCGNGNCIPITAAGNSPANDHATTSMRDGLALNRSIHESTIEPLRTVWEFLVKSARQIGMLRSPLVQPSLRDGHRIGAPVRGLKPTATFMPSLRDSFVAERRLTVAVGFNPRTRRA